MVQLGGFLYHSLRETTFVKEFKNNLVSGLENEANNFLQILYLILNSLKKVNAVGERITKCSAITLADNDIKDSMKVMSCLENKGILLKKTTEETIIQERESLDFLGFVNKSLVTINEKCTYTIS